MKVLLQFNYDSFEVSAAVAGITQPVAQMMAVI